jgi:hypothetical protein
LILTQNLSLRGGAIIRPEPPPVLATTNRRRRYKVGPGELISLRPDKKHAAG